MSLLVSIVKRVEVVVDVGRKKLEDFINQPLLIFNQHQVLGPSRSYNTIVPNCVEGKSKTPLIIGDHVLYILRIAHVVSSHPWSIFDSVWNPLMRLGPSAGSLACTRNK